MGETLCAGFLLSTSNTHRNKRLRLGDVIVMTFWYIFGMDLTFFRTFFIGIDHDPHDLYVHMTYVYSPFLCFTLHTITWPREVIIVL